MQRSIQIRQRPISQTSVAVLLAIATIGLQFSICVAQESVTVVSLPRPIAALASRLISEPAFPNSEAPKPYGQVRGMVRDINGKPVRYAHLWLQDAHPKAMDDVFVTNMDRDPGPQTATAGLDGSFTFDPVPPGQYLLGTKAAGFLGTIKLPHRVPPILTVADEQVTEVKAILSPGGAVEGVVQFDDGSPAIGMKIQLLAKNISEKGELRWVDAGLARTDDAGYWHIANVDAGKYIISSTAPDTILRFSGFLTPTQQTGGGGGGSYLTVFYGGAYGTKSAHLFTLHAREHKLLRTLVIHPSAFHTLTATIRSRDTKRPVNGGYASLSSKITGFNAQAEVDRVGVVRFRYVPEGEYTMTIRASDVGPSTFRGGSFDENLAPGFPDPIRNYLE